MVTIKQIRDALAANDYAALRTLHDSAKTQGIEDCDDQQLVTVNLCVLECSLFRDTSAGHIRSLTAMLDAIDRGNHPYDDIITQSTLGAEAAIAQAQIDAMVGRGKK